MHSNAVFEVCSVCVGLDHTLLLISKSSSHNYFKI